MSRSDAPKVPLKGFIDRIKNLPPGTKSILQNAFSEGEELLDIHNNSIIQRENRRRRSPLVLRPQITVNRNSLGFDVTWPRLSDRRITCYDVQVSLTSNFSNPDTFQVVDTNYSAEGIGTKVYVRVRGVRFGGLVGLWSNVEEVEPLITAPIVYTKSISDFNSFYMAHPAFSDPNYTAKLTVTPMKRRGGIMIFGSVGAGFYAHDPSFDAMPALAATSNFETENQGLVASVRVNGRSITRTRIDLYGSGFGASAAFGPAFLDHSGFYMSLYNNYFTYLPDDLSSGSSGGGVHTGWSNVGNHTQRPFLEEDITDFSVAGSRAITYRVTGLVGTGATARSSFLKFSKFKFAIPPDYQIYGIALHLMSHTNVLAQSTAPNIQSLRLYDSDGTTRANQAPGSGITIPLQSSTSATAIPLTYTTIGGENYFFGESATFWTPAKINDIDFGVDFRIEFTGNASVASDETVGIWPVEMSIFCKQPREEANIEVFVSEGDFSFNGIDTREAAPMIKNLNINAIEFGE